MSSSPFAAARLVAGLASLTVLATGVGAKTVAWPSGPSLRVAVRTVPFPRPGIQPIACPRTSNCTR